MELQLHSGPVRKKNKLLMLGRETVRNK
jgi:hypothetical protein